MTNLFFPWKHCKRQWWIQTSSDFSDSSLVDCRRFFRPSLRRLLVPGPNMEMAPAGIYNKPWINKMLNTTQNTEVIQLNSQLIKQKSTFFSGGLTGSATTSFLTWTGVVDLNLSPNILPSSSSSSSKRSTVVLDLGFSFTTTWWSEKLGWRTDLNVSFGP